MTERMNQKELDSMLDSLENHELTDEGINALKSQIFQYHEIVNHLIEHGRNCLEPKCYCKLLDVNEMLGEKFE